MQMRLTTAVFAFFCMLGAVGAIAVPDLLRSVHRNWSDPYDAFSHGYMVLGMALWLAVESWRVDPPRVANTWWAPVPLLVLAVFALWLMDVMLFDSARQILLPVMVWAAVAVVFGPAVGSTLLWPLLYLYVALPQWLALNPALQWLTVKVANALVALTDLPAYVEGDFFHLPAGTIEVQTGCAGLNYVLVALSLALFQGLRFLRSWNFRLRLVAAAVVIALVANWLRVYLLVLIGFVTDMQHYLVRVEHFYFGWVFFACCMWPLLLYASRLERREDLGAPSASIASAGSAPSKVAFSPIPVIGCLALMFVPAIIEHLARPSAAYAVPPVPPQRTTSSESLTLASQVEHTSWEVDDVPIEFGRRFLPLQTREAHLRGDVSEVLAASEVPYWQVARQTANWVEMSRPGGARGGRPMLARVGYGFAGQTTRDAGVRAKQALLMGAFRGRRDGLVWIAATPCIPDCAAGSRHLDATMPLVRSLTTPRLVSEP